MSDHNVLKMANGKSVVVLSSHAHWWCDLLVICERELTQARAKQRTSQQYSAKYTPELEKEKHFEADSLCNRFVTKVFVIRAFKDNEVVNFIQVVRVKVLANKSSVPKFKHVQIANWANSYSKT